MKKVIGKLMLFVAAFGLIACVIGATNEWIYALYFILVLDSSNSMLCSF